MNRPRGSAPLDPATRARLQQILDPRTAAAPAPARRPAAPAGPDLDVAYVLDVTHAEGRAIVDVRIRPVLPGQRPGRWEPARLTLRNIERFSKAADRAILVALLHVEASTASVRVTQSAKEPPSRFVLSRAACAQLLPLMGRTGRLCLRGAAATVAVVWQEAPWALRLVATVAPDPPPTPDAGPSWDVRGVLRSGGVEVELTQLDGFMEGGFAAARGWIGRVDDGGASSWLGMLRTHPKVRITPSRRAAFLEELYALPGPPPLDLPLGVALAEAAPPMSPSLRIRAPDPSTPAGTLLAEVSFVYDGVAVSPRRPGKVAFDAARMRVVRRDVEAEAKATARLDALGARPLSKGTALPAGADADRTHVSLPAARLPLIAAALSGEGWQVEASGRTYRKPASWQMGIASGVDWLDVSGWVEFDGMTAHLPAVLAALRQGETTVVLDDGSLGVLPEAWLARHGLVLHLGVPHEGGLRFSPSQVPLLASLAAADPTVQTDEVFAARMRDAEALAGTVEPGEPREDFKGELRAYQKAGLGWLRWLERARLGGLLADDMGLGKTVQVIAHLAGREPRRTSLVVAPRSLIFNWKREAARFAPHLRLLDHTGPDRQPPGDHFARFDVVLTTYGTLRRDVEGLATLDLDYLVLDEAQAIKNDTSETARAARRLRAAQKLALSGTPVENHLGELWSIMELLNPGMLGRAAAWKAATASSPSPDAVALLGRALKPIMLRRTKTEVAPDLPARLEETWVCELDAPDRALYEDLRARFRAEILGRAKTGGVGSAQAQVLTALLRLRQAACHPGLLDPARRGERGPKLDALLPELSALAQNGQKALVFSQFRDLLDLARPQVEAEGIGCAQLDGTTRDREAVVARFQEDPACQVLLVSLKAGGVGLNLTAAEYVFLLDPWWNPAAEAQAIDRAHRIGQTRPVFAYRLIAKDTVEERIADLQQRKRALAESVIRGDGAPLRELSIEDLERLFS